MMRNKRGSIHIGTSGWHYKHWIGTFYPEGLRAEEQLDYYLYFFDTVEINNSFYHLPPQDTFRKWHENTPDDFRFAVKASRYITHMKKLHDTGAAVDLFLGNASALQKKLGVVLFQLPPGWPVNTERLRAFLESLPSGERYAFEFRNPTWYTAEIYDLLAEHNCAFCGYELAGHLSPLQVTADFVYIRLHGPGAKYQGSYSDRALKQWADQTGQWRALGKDVYIYFDNDQNGYAAYNALTLKDLTLS